ncbi:MAG: hypothetical protein PHN66_02140 [Candidatus Shapirobacteria bacterium]|nr:hypothetical protein [Candidatus Shapirobacteria bacterium]
MKNILRWIAVLPSSIIGMIIVFALWKIINNLTGAMMANYIDPNSWMSILLIEVMSNMVAGVVFVSIGYKVAPNNQKITALILTILFTLIGSYSFFIVNFISKEYFSNIGIISGIFGSVICYIGIYRGEFDKK